MSVIAPVSVDEVLGPKYVVEAIIGKRTRAGQIQYLIKWEGFDEIESTWEPATHCYDSHDLIKAYEKEKRKKKAHTANKVKKEVMSEEYERYCPSAQSLVSKTAQEKFPVLEEPFPGKIYEVQKGKKVSKILAVRPGREAVGLVAMVLYEDRFSELVPTVILGANAFAEILAFYEQRIIFEDQENW